MPPRENSLAQKAMLRDPLLAPSGKSILSAGKSARRENRNSQDWQILSQRRNITATQDKKTAAGHKFLLWSDFCIGAYACRTTYTFSTVIRSNAECRGVKGILGNGLGI
jgi:hypothetical protein